MKVLVQLVNAPCSTEASHLWPRLGVDDDGRLEHLHKEFAYNLPWCRCR